MTTNIKAALVAAREALALTKLKCYCDPKYALPDINKAITQLTAAIEEIDKAEPVAKIRRNAAGQIYMIDVADNSFDVSKFVGADLYLHPAPTIPNNLDEIVKRLDNEFCQELADNDLYMSRVDGLTLIARRLLEELRK